MDDVNSLVTPNANRRDHTQHGFFFEVKAEFLNKETWEQWPTPKWLPVPVVDVGGRTSVPFLRWRALMITAHVMRSS